MTGRVPVCDLCKRAPRRRSDSILCRDCADAISRVMSSDIYEANYYQNRQAQVAQARLLTRAATASNTTSENSQDGSPQGWIWFSNR